MKLYIKSAMEFSDISQEDPDFILSILKSPRTRGGTLTNIYTMYVTKNNLSIGADTAHKMRVALASNPNTPANILVKLSEWSKEICRLVVENRNAPAELLTELSKDRIAAIRKSVAKHPNTPANVLKELSKDIEAIVRLSVATNHNTPEPTLKKLSRDKNWYVREGVAKNAMTPKSILEVLLNDPEEDIRNAASNALKYK